MYTSTCGIILRVVNLRHASWFPHWFSRDISMSPSSVPVSRHRFRIEADNYTKIFSYSLQQIPVSESRYYVCT